ncbi:MAG TPA: peptidoglycan-binding protein [Polyangium sp.]|nr:peptidoglycan-binding protein [Polyangium sp.]
MPIHVVQQGECLSKIAARYGFGDYRVLYDHPDNAELKKKRVNPNVLEPGDRIVIPDKDLKVEEGLATGKLHRFRVRRPRKELRLKLEGHDGKPLAGAAYVLDVGGERHEGTTDGDGKLEQKVPVSETTGKLTIAGRVLHLRLGHLNPLDAADGGISGAQGRLSNLGYNPGPVDGVLGRRTRTALALFQHDEKLDVTGKLDDTTKKKLEEKHGS